MVNELEASPLAPSFSPADGLSSIEPSDQSSYQVMEESDSCDLTSSQDNCKASDSVSSQPNPCYGVKLVGDNIDQTVNPTHMRSDRQSNSQLLSDVCCQGQN